MVRFKLLAAMLIVGVAMSAGVGGTILSHSYADDPTYAKPQPNPVNGNPYQNPTKNNSKPTPGTVVNNGSPELIEALREWYVDLSPPAEVKSWDYKVVALHDPQTELVKLGREGWELVAIDRVQGTTANSSGPIAYLKKQIPQNPTVAYGSILNSRLNQLQPPSTSQPNGNNTPTVTGSYYDPLNGKATGSETTVNPNSSPKKEVKGSLKVFRLKNGNAKEIAQILRGLFVKEPGFKDAVSEQRTNSLIVHGSDEILKQIEALLQNLDSVKTDDKR